MLHFLLNDKVIETDQPVGAILLGFLRDQQGLIGAEPACHEGDCGSYMALLGEWRETLTGHRARETVTAILDDH